MKRMDGLKVRAMTAMDIDVVHQIETASFSVPWSRAIFEEAYANDDNEFWVADINGEIAGYINLWYVLDEVTVANIAVAERFRRQGVAAALMERALKLSEESGKYGITLEVRISNEPAIKLYERFGFKSVGIRPGYYEKPREDAVIMWKYFH